MKMLTFSQNDSTVDFGPRVSYQWRSSASKGPTLLAAEVWSDCVESHDVAVRRLKQTDDIWSARFSQQGAAALISAKVMLSDSRSGRLENKSGCLYSVWLLSHPHDSPLITSWSRRERRFSPRLLLASWRRWSWQLIGRRWRTTCSITAPPSAAKSCFQHPPMTAGAWNNNQSYTLIDLDHLLLITAAFDHCCYWSLLLLIAAAIIIIPLKWKQNQYQSNEKVSIQPEWIQLIIGIQIWTFVHNNYTNFQGLFFFPIKWCETHQLYFWLIRFDRDHICCCFFCTLIDMVPLSRIVSLSWAVWIPGCCWF